MAVVGASGADETIKIPVITTVAGVKESIEQLKSLSRQLTAIDKQLRSGLNSDSLNKQFQNIAKEFEKVTKSVTSGSAQSEKSIERMTSQVSKFNAELAKAQKSKGVGFVGNKDDAVAVKAYKERMDMAGHAVMAQPKNLSMAIANIRRFKKDMHDTSKVSVATAATLRAIDGGPPAFGRALSDSQKLKASMAVLRENLMHVSLQFRSMAKDMQWVGRQMAEGITAPIVGIGVMATRSFMSVQSEMIQLKKVTEFGAETANADAFYDSLVNGADGIREMSREFGVGRKSATALFKDVAALGVDGEDDIKAFSKAVGEIAMVGEVDTNSAMQFFRTMNAIFAGGRTNSEGLAETRDLMAQMSAVADETSLQLADLAAAFPEVAPVMKQMGFSAGGVAASLAGMYKRGIPATEAAHGLKFALQRLVSPTKDSAEIIDKMGFSFFDAGGNIKKADLEIMALAKNLKQMTPEAASKSLGELFGLRQTARMQSYFEDINIGRVELEELAAGARDASSMTSDFARGLVASGEFAGAALKPMDRYNKALEEIKKDPTTGLKRLKAGFEDFKVELGAALAPAILRVGEIVIKVLDLFGKMPGFLQISIVAAGAFVAALAPIMIIAAQATHAFVTLGRTALRVLPKLDFNFTPSVASRSIGAGQDTGMTAGDKTFRTMNFRETMRNAFGMRSKAEKAVEAAGDAAQASSLGPETAATSSLTAAKNNLTVASNSVAAAEVRETAAHNGNTASMRAQTIATQAASKKNMDVSKKNADVFKTPVQKAQEARRQLEEERRKILAAGGFEPTGFKSGPKFRGRKGFVKDADVEAYVAEQIARQKAAQKVIENNQRNQDNLRRYNELMRQKRMPKPTPPVAPPIPKVDNLKQGFAAVIPVIALLGIKILAIVAVVAAVAAVIFAFTKAFRDNWDAFVKKLQPGIESIKKAFNKVKEAVGEVVEIFTDVIGQLGSGTDETGKTASAIEGFGETISRVLELIAKNMEFFAEVVKFLKPVIEFFAYYVKNMIGVVSSLIRGDYKSAMEFMAAATYEVIRPILMAFDNLAKGIAHALSIILGTVNSVITKMPDPLGIFDGISSKLSNAQAAVSEFSDKGFIPILDEKLRGLGGLFGDAAASSSSDAADAGKDLGADLGDGINDGVAGAADGASWLKEWVSSVYDAMDEEINRVKESATRAMQKAQDAALKIYDQRIKAIEDQESAEQKLFKTEEYLSRKRELLAKRNIDKQNYQNEKALAIYEGRYNEARMLDLKEQADKKAYSDSLGEIENDRSGDLIKEERDLAKKQIEIQKEAAQERFQIEADLLKAFLDEIFKYKPATVGEFQSMLDRVNVLLENAGVSWPDYATKAMERFQSVFAAANRSIVEDFEKSGKDSITAWMAGAISPEAKAIIQAGLNAGSGGGAEQSGGAPAEEGGGAPDLSFLNNMQKDRPLQLTAAFASKVNMQKILLKGQFESGVISVEQYKDKLKSLNEKQKEFISKTIPTYLDAIKSGNVELMGEIERTIKGTISSADEFGNKWTATSDGLINQFGQVGKVVYDESGKIVGITNLTTGQISSRYKFSFDEIKLLATNAGKTIGDTTVQSTRLATTVLKEMTDQGIRPGTEEAAKYEQRIKGLGYQVSTVNNQSILIPIAVDDTDAKAKLGSLYRLISEANLEIAKDPDTPFFRKPIAFAKASAYGLMASSLGYASGGLVRAQKDGIIANIGEGGFDEYVITTDPKYRASNLGYLSAAASKLGVKMASGYAVKAAAGGVYKMASGGAYEMASGGMVTSAGSGGSSAEYASGMGGDVYINVDTFIGEEEWFASMASKYNMKTVPRQRKIEGQQKRVVSSYNDRYRLR